MATTFSGAVIRTTHVTGIFTDLGIMLGALARGESLDMRKAKLFLFIIAGFILGGTIGTLVFKQFQFMALLAPAAICFLMAITYQIYANSRN